MHDVVLKAYRTHGAIEVMHDALKALSPMTSDVHTQNLLHVAREALSLAIASSKTYAEETEKRYEPVSVG